MRSRKRTRPMSSYLDRQKIGLKGSMQEIHPSCHSRSQSEHRISFVLTTCRFSRTMMYIIALKKSLMSDSPVSVHSERTWSQVTSLFPLLLHWTTLTGDWWMEEASCNSRSCSFQISTSPLCQPMARIFLTGCHAIAVTKLERWIEDSSTNSPC